MLENEPENAAERLRKILETAKPGLIEDTDAIETLMYESWDDFKGSMAQGMDREKLGRVEQLMWDPPSLLFEIERHGAIVAGASTRGTAVLDARSRRT